MRNQFEHIETHNLKRRHLTTIKKSHLITTSSHFCSLITTVIWKIGEFLWLLQEMVYILLPNRFWSFSTALFCTSWFRFFRYLRSPTGIRNFFLSSFYFLTTQINRTKCTDHEYHIFFNSSRIISKILGVFIWLNIKLVLDPKDH